MFNIFFFLAFELSVGLLRFAIASLNPPFFSAAWNCFSHFFLCFCIHFFSRLNVSTGCRYKQCLQHITENPPDLNNHHAAVRSKFQEAVLDWGHLSALKMHSLCWCICISKLNLAQFVIVVHFDGNDIMIAINCHVSEISFKRSTRLCVLLLFLLQT